MHGDSRFRHACYAYLPAPRCASAASLHARPDPVPAVQAVLETLPAVRRAWLFGPRARGDHMPRADCHIVIEAPGATGAQWAEILAALDNARTLIPLDIIRLHPADAALREEILRSGRLIHER